MNCPFEDGLIMNKLNTELLVGVNATIIVTFPRLRLFCQAYYLEIRLALFPSII